jgi:hypothetical protein
MKYFTHIINMFRSSPPSTYHWWPQLALKLHHGSTMQGSHDLQRAAEGGHDGVSIYMPSCCTETMAVTTARSGTWGGSRAVAVRCQDGWAMRGVCLSVRRTHVRSTPRLGTFGVNRCRVRHRCVAISRVQAMVAAAAWIKMASNFSILQRRL